MFCSSNWWNHWEIIVFPSKENNVKMSFIREHHSKTPCVRRSLKLKQKHLIFMICTSGSQFQEGKKFCCFFFFFWLIFFNKPVKQIQFSAWTNTLLKHIANSFDCLCVLPMRIWSVSFPWGSGLIYCTWNFSLSKFWNLKKRVWALAEIQSTISRHNLGRIDPYIFTFRNLKNKTRQKSNHFLFCCLLSIKTFQ